MREWQLPIWSRRDQASYEPDLQEWGPIVVPADSFFMMGDNPDTRRRALLGLSPAGECQG